MKILTTNFAIRNSTSFSSKNFVFRITKLSKSNFEHYKIHWIVRRITRKKNSISILLFLFRYLQCAIFLFSNSTFFCTSNANFFFRANWLFSMNRALCTFHSINKSNICFCTKTIVSRVIFNFVIELSIFSWNHESSIMLCDWQNNFRTKILFWNNSKTWCRVTKIIWSKTLLKKMTL